MFRIYYVLKSTLFLGSLAEVALGEFNLQGQCLDHHPITAACIASLDQMDAFYVTRFFFNMTSNQCEGFPFFESAALSPCACREDTLNNFDSMADCQENCQGERPPPVLPPQWTQIFEGTTTQPRFTETRPHHPSYDLRCSQPTRSGPCLSFVILYGYDKVSKRCQPFFGCNGTWFQTIRDCQEICEIADDWESWTPWVTNQPRTSTQANSGLGQVYSVNQGVIKQIFVAFISPWKLADCNSPTYGEVYIGQACNAGSGNSNIMYQFSRVTGHCQSFVYTGCR